MKSPKYQIQQISPLFLDSSIFDEESVFGVGETCLSTIKQQG